MEMGKLQTREGTTILVGAVIDDIIGIVILSIVISVSSVVKAGEDISIASIGLDAIRIAAVGLVVWLALPCS